MVVCDVEWSSAEIKC